MEETSVTPLKLAVDVVADSSMSWKATVIFAKASGCSNRVPSTIPSFPGPAEAGVVLSNNLAAPLSGYARNLTCGPLVGPSPLLGRNSTNTSSMCSVSAPIVMIALNRALFPTLMSCVFPSKSISTCCVGSRARNRAPEYSTDLLFGPRLLTTTECSARVGLPV